jgi:hypothetical protein
MQAAYVRENDLPQTEQRCGLKLVSIQQPPCQSPTSIAYSYVLAVAALFTYVSGRGEPGGRAGCRCVCKTRTGRAPVRLDGH